MQHTTKLLLYGNPFKKLYEKSLCSQASCRGLSCNEIHILLFLAGNPGCDTAKDISEMLSISKSNVSKAVDSLIRRGFLTSCEDEKDRRICHLFIQPCAGEPIREAQAVQEQFLSRLLKGFSEEERRTLENLMSRMSDNIQEDLLC